MLSSEELDDFFKQEELTLIVDISNLAYRALYAIIYSSPTDNGKFELWKHTFLNSIFYVIKKFNPTRVIFAEDGSKNWRYDVYPQYKWERKIKKEKSDIRWDKFYEVLNELLEDIKIVFTNIISLKVDRSEADDVISVMSREIKYKIIIVSGDNDFNQLLSQRVRQYKPITETFVECINTQKALQLKLLVGDKGDSIPNLRPRLGIKTAASILESGLEAFLDSNTVLRENYERNKKLIDLTCIPSEICDGIINKFDEYQISPIDMNLLLKFFNKHRLQKILASWNVLGESIKKLR